MEAKRGGSRQSVWSLVEEHVPHSELPEIRRVLGGALVDMYTEVHSEVEMWRVIYREAQWGVNRLRTPRSHHQGVPLADPPSIKELLRGEIRMLLQSIRERASREGRDGEEALSRYHPDTVNYVLGRSETYRRPSSGYPSNRSKIPENTDQHGRRPGSACSNRSSVSDDLTALKEKLNMADIDHVVAHLRSVLTEDCDALKREVLFLQESIEQEYRSQCVVEPTVTELREQRRAIQMDLELPSPLLPHQPLSPSSTSSSPLPAEQLSNTSRSSPGKASLVNVLSELRLSPTPALAQIKLKPSPPGSAHPAKPSSPIRPVLRTGEQRGGPTNPSETGRMGTSGCQRLSHRGGVHQARPPLSPVGRSSSFSGTGNLSVYDSETPKPQNGRRERSYGINGQTNDSRRKGSSESLLGSFTNRPSWSATGRTKSSSDNDRRIPSPPATVELQTQLCRQKGTNCCHLGKDTPELLISDIPSPPKCIPSIQRRQTAAEDARTQPPHAHIAPVKTDRVSNPSAKSPPIRAKVTQAGLEGGPSEPLQPVPPAVPKTTTREQRLARRPGVRPACRTAAGKTPGSKG